ncbi:3'(2'),5'-bisphosphate nucleotidase CysQ [Kaistia sp. UC242_56]|uniref:3'(2'),5'-bisphosphate nucleotidase CysQ n=1 Tax=Kaistia sp. UC242_56 TaxID=3374625 RepID=UPI00379FB2E1
MADRAADLALLIAAAREAGQIALGYFKRDPKVWTKGANSPVTEADLAANHALHATLTAARPDYGWLSEESADTPDRLDRRRLFVVDPIDGTRGFIDGNPDWCVSVALVEDGAAVAAALFVPAREELFEATAGGGARLNGEAIRVSDRQALEGARIAGPARHLRAMAGHGMDPRERRFTPSLAYRFALVACGRVDVATARPGAYDWDLAAVDLLVQEAGGTLRDLEGAPLRFNDVIPRHPALIASTPGLASAAMAIIAEAEAAHEASGPGAL